MRIELQNIELALQRSFRTLDHFIDFRSDCIVSGNHCNCIEHPDKTRGEEWEPHERFISYEGTTPRASYRAIEVYWSKWEVDGLIMEEYCHWIVELYCGNSVEENIKVRFKEEKKARKFYSIARDYLLKKFIH